MAHLGLREAQQIAAILVNPRGPNRVFVAALGHPNGPTTQSAASTVPSMADRGWQKVPYQDEHTGAVDLAFDPRNPRTVYAVRGRRARGRGRTAISAIVHDTPVEQGE